MSGCRGPPGLGQGRTAKRRMQRKHAWLRLRAGKRQTCSIGTQTEAGELEDCSSCCLEAVEGTGTALPVEALPDEAAVSTSVAKAEVALDAARGMGMAAFIELTRVLCTHRWHGEHDKVPMHTGMLMASSDTCYVVQQHEEGHTATTDTVFRLSELYDTIVSLGVGQHEREAVHHALEARLQQQVGAQACHEALNGIAKKGLIGYHSGVVTLEDG